ncbi:MAG: histidine--tRNA ligase [Saprospiraceae bacterium]|nr:histidine--tRNA ligase [Saprospiraceae bacterium]
MSKPSIPEGVRDFSPEVVAKRNYIFDAIKKVFVKYGFQPIETPTLEKLSTLTGKYGDEGDKLLFKVLNNGDFLAKTDPSVLEAKNSSKLVSQICDRGLRYDLTVPFARYVVMHQNEIAFPFKRYQIQPVWRADRPQRGRYREFYQCDVDVVGSNSLVYEAELVQIYDEVFTNLGLDVVIKVNNRKILFGMAEAAGIPDKFMDMTVAIDKLDKIGWDGVAKELAGRGIGEEAIETIRELLTINNLTDLEKFGDKSDSLLRGIQELRTFHEYFDFKGSKNEVRFDITLARGLNYYTGCIFEVAAKGVKMGSIGGGGRYDDLTGVFGLKGVSGVGVSFGADRIYDCLAELDLFPKENQQSLKLLFVAFDAETHRFAFKCLNETRAAGINSEIYPDATKLKKQMDYANKRGVPYVCLIGSDEMDSGLLTLKNMATGEQEKISIANIIEKLA